MKVNIEPSIQRVGNWDEAVVDDISLVMQYGKSKMRDLTEEEQKVCNQYLDWSSKPVPSKYPISEEGLNTFLKNFEEHVYPVIEEAGGVEKLEAIVKRRRAESAILQKQIREAKERKNKENGE